MKTIASKPDIDHEDGQCMIHVSEFEFT
jgi:hypothetical protein